MDSCSIKKDSRSRVTAVWAGSPLATNIAIVAVKMEPGGQVALQRTTAVEVGGPIFSLTEKNAGRQL